jgi:uncharacterized protein YmfQ (DUF2313 family)
MALSAEDYLRQLQALLPTGAAWPRDENSLLTKLLRAFADGLARVDRRADDLMNEINPFTTSELLGDWEKESGLPDPCLTEAATANERRLRLYQRRVWHGGQSREFFIGLLAALGYPGCTITEFRPMRTNSKCNAAINGGGWRYAWRVNVPAAADVKPLKANGRCNEALASWGDPGIYCLLNRYGPADAVVFVSYGEDA